MANLSEAKKRNDQWEIDTKKARDASKTANAETTAAEARLAEAIADAKAESTIADKAINLANTETAAAEAHLAKAIADAKA